MPTHPASANAAAPEPAAGRAGLERALFGNGCILLATLFWGVNYAFTKALIPVWMSADAVSAVRIAGGAALFWLASLFIKNERLDRQSLIRAAGGGAVGIFGCIYLFVLALDYGSPIDISIIMAMPPIFVILMEVIFLGRRPSWLVYAGIVVSFAGAAVVILSAGGEAGEAANPMLGDLLAVAAAASFAIYLVVLAKPSAVYRPVTLLRWVFLFASIPGLFLVPALLRSPIMATTEPVPWLEIGFILFCPTFFSYLLTQPAEKAIGAVLVSLYQYLTPVVATISAVLMGQASLRWQQALAMAVIVAGMLLTNFGKSKGA